MFSYQYAYLVLNLFLFSIWLILFVFRSDLRTKIIVMSLLVAPLGFTQFFYFRDYWHPAYLFGTLRGVLGIEDVLISFFIGGITAVIYEEIFGIQYAKRHLKNHFWWMLGFSVFGVLWLFVGNILLNLNSMHVSIAILLLTGVSILIFRHDLLKDAFYSGVLIGGLMFIFYVLCFNTMFDGIVQKWWLLNHISGILVLGVPLEELMWAFSWGFVAGPTYEFFTGRKFKKSF